MQWSVLCQAIHIEMNETPFSPVSPSTQLEPSILSSRVTRQSHNLIYNTPLDLPFSVGWTQEALTDRHLWCKASCNSLQEQPHGSHEEDRNRNYKCTNVLILPLRIFQSSSVTPDFNFERVAKIWLFFPQPAVVRPEFLDFCHLRILRQKSVINVVYCLKMNTHLRENDVESTPEHCPITCINVSIHTSFLMIRSIRFEGSGVERAVSDFRNPSPYKAVKVEWDSSVGYSFVARGRVRLSRERNTQSYTWLSGRMTFKSLSPSWAWTLVYSQSLAAKPPTRTTCWGLARQEKSQGVRRQHTAIDLCAFVFCSKTALAMQWTDGWKNIATSEL